MLLAHLESAYPLIRVAEDLGTWLRQDVGTFMISRPSLQYSDWMKFRIWNGVRRSSQSSFSMQICALRQRVTRGSEGWRGCRGYTEGCTGE